MLEGLLEGTALPNLHPAIVHFPIALVTTALLFEVAILTLPRLRELGAASGALWLLAAAGGGAPCRACRIPWGGIQSPA